MTPLEQLDRAMYLNDLAGLAICGGRFDKAADLLLQAAEVSPSAAGRRALIDRAADASLWAVQVAERDKCARRHSA